MLSAITNARKSIYLEMYIFNNDTEDYNFLQELVKSAQRGVKVVVILDVFGSKILGKDAVAELRDAGVEVLFFSFFFRRTHRKILIIDGVTAFVGGVNIRQRFTFWKDLQVQVSGRIVGSILRSFARMYKECGGKDQLLTSISRSAVLPRAKMWFVERGVGKREHLLREYYEKRIVSARKNITIVTPFLFPPRWLIAHLHQAILRGVVVEILLPEKTDPHFATKINHSFASFLTRLGVQCYFMPSMNHAKAMLIDGREGMIGSQNFDRLSFHWNAEAGVFFHEPEMVRDLVRITEGWKKESTLFNPATAKFHWYDIPLAFLLRVLGLLPLW